MLTFGKTSAVALAAMSCLAESYGIRSVSSGDIASLRHLPRPHVAKVLTRLAAMRLVTGTRGPGGGYRLARPPATISIAEVIEPFEQSRQQMMCPFGPDWCGSNDPCPMHRMMLSLHQSNLQALQTMNLSVFAEE